MQFRAALVAHQVDTEFVGVTGIAGPGGFELDVAPSAVRMKCRGEIFDFVGRDPG